ncbi:MAG: ASKHA domain-containing protein [Phycisphaerae bacterium]
MTFQPAGRSVQVLPGTTVLEAAGRASLPIETPCGGAGTCGKCRVQFTTGAPEPTVADRRFFSDDQLEDGWRLACRTRIVEEAVVSIPAASLVGGGGPILTRWQGGGDADIQSAVRKVYVELPPPSLADPAADLLRLEHAVGRFRADLDVLAAVPGKLRAANYRGTCVLTDHRLIDFQPGDTTAQCAGVAVDIGTTTVAATLVDLAGGQELAVAACMNPQVRFGDDVLSRIMLASKGPDELKTLQRGIIEAVGELIDELCRQASFEPDDICEIAFAGNTTMQHLLCGIDPTPLGTVPFAPAVARGLLLRAAELGISIHPRGTAQVMPVIGGFVGGDTVAGVLATGLPTGELPAMLVDIGTNGEIVLATEDGTLHAASTAAGPAFEGARISCGMRAADGAIEKVAFDGGPLQVSVIGGGKASGLCGSALVDVAAILLEAGIVTPEGRMLLPEELPAAVPEALRCRLRQREGDVAFQIAGEDGSEVVLTQRDIRELQLASGAIRAGVSILLRQAGLEATDLKRVCIAGGLGSFIRRSGAQRIGLIPGGIPHERIHYVGNAALQGARAALLSTAFRTSAEKLAREARHVELSQDMDFQMEFAEAMIFPPQQG